MSRYQFLTPQNLTGTLELEVVAGSKIDGEERNWHF